MTLEPEDASFHWRIQVLDKIGKNFRFVKMMHAKYALKMLQIVSYPPEALFVDGLFLKNQMTDCEKVYAMFKSFE